MKIQAPKGTRDLLPQESYQWQYIEGKLREITGKYNIREVRTPIFEHTELFLRGVGDTTDIVQKEMYTFEDRGGRSITLRPEGTAGAVRSFIEHGLCDGPQPTKMCYISAPVFRYERPQAGRLRQHHQFGIEIFGAKEATADAEAILLAYTVLQTLGVYNLLLNLNSIGCPTCRPKYSQALKQYYQDKREALCPTCLDRLERNPLRLLDCKEPKCQEIAKGAPKMIEYLCSECQQHFEQLQQYLADAGVAFQINPYIVRGLDYYTKTVFEIISSEIGAQGTVCGGGRYDGLIAEIGGPQMCGVGFGMGIERLLMVMQAAGVQIPKPSALKIFFCAMGPDARRRSFSLMQELRAAGIAADMDHNARSLKAQMKYADKVGAEYVALIGEEELQKGCCKLRDMKGSQESEVSLEKLAEALR